MGKLDDLLNIIRGVIAGFKLPDHLSADNNKISVEISPLKSQKTVTINGPVIIINADTAEGQEIANQIFQNADLLLSTGERAIETDFGKLIAGAKPYVDGHKEDNLFLEQVAVFVPKKDMPIIEAALFVRKLYKSNASVVSYKTLLLQQYGSRGNNISNLLTAGYYENYLLPLYEHLQETEGNLAKTIFNEFYEEAVTQYPFAVFVSHVKGYALIKEEVGNKIQLNLLSEQHTLNIHGIGKTNKKTIIALLKDADITRFYLSDPDIVELEKTVYARIYF